MKKYILIFAIIFNLQIAYSQSNFYNGFNDGYKKGYCQNQGIGCISPTPPIAPIPKIGENINSYQDGYNRGFEEGLNAQKKTNNNTQKGYVGTEAEFVQDGMYSPYKDSNVLNLAMKVAELKSKRLSELYENGVESYNNDNYSDAIYYANEIIKIDETISEAYALKAMSYLYKKELLNSYNNISKAKKLNYSGEDNIKLINKEVQDYLSKQMTNQKLNDVIYFGENTWFESNLTNYFLAMAYYYKDDFKTAKKYFKKFDFEPSKTYLEAIKENKVLPNPFISQNRNKGVFSSKEVLIKYFENVSNLYASKKYKETIELINTEINNLPNDYKYGFERLYCIRGLSNYTLHNYHEAISDFKISLQNSDKINPNIYFLSALAKSEVKDYYGAISDYDKLIEIGENGKGTNYDFATIFNNKAYCLTSLKKYTEALPLVKKALEINKSYWYIWDTKGEIEFNLGNFNQCIVDMSEAIKIKKDANSLYYRGLSYLKLGKKELACKDLTSSGEMGKKDAYYEINKYCK